MAVLGQPRTRYWAPWRHTTPVGPSCPTFAVPADNPPRKLDTRARARGASISWMEARRGQAPAAESAAAARPCWRGSRQAALPLGCRRLQPVVSRLSERDPSGYTPSRCTGAITTGVSTLRATPARCPSSKVRRSVLLASLPFLSWHSTGSCPRRRFFRFSTCSAIVR